MRFAAQSSDWEWMGGLTFFQARRTKTQASSTSASQTSASALGFG